MVKLFWTDESIHWLKEIHTYISKENKTAARKVIADIIDQANKVTSFPLMGQKLSDWPQENIRMILYGHYRIVYNVVSKKRIDILGVYHGTLDLKTHLKR